MSRIQGNLFRLRLWSKITIKVGYHDPVILKVTVSATVCNLIRIGLCFSKVYFRSGAFFFFQMFWSYLVSLFLKSVSVLRLHFFLLTQRLWLNPDSVKIKSLISTKARLRIRWNDKNGSSAMCRPPESFLVFCLHLLCLLPGSDLALQLLTLLNTNAAYSATWIICWERYTRQNNILS